MIIIERFHQHLDDLKIDLEEKVSPLKAQLGSHGLWFHIHQSLRIFHFVFLVLMYSLHFIVHIFFRTSIDLRQVDEFHKSKPRSPWSTATEQPPKNFHIATADTSQTYQTEANLNKELRLRANSLWTMSAEASEICKAQANAEMRGFASIVVSKHFSG